MILDPSGSKSYSVGREVEQIQTEIMTNGPVEAAFTVYADFPTYKSGKQSKHIQNLGTFPLHKMMLFVCTQKWLYVMGDKFTVRCNYRTIDQEM